MGYPGTGNNGFGARPLLFGGTTAGTRAERLGGVDRHGGHLLTGNGSSVLFGAETSGYVHLVSTDAAGDVAAGTNASRDLTPLPCDTQDWSGLGGGEGGEEQHVFVSHNCDLVHSGHL